jgi:hypothetical protein
LNDEIFCAWGIGGALLALTSRVNSRGVNAVDISNSPVTFLEIFNKECNLRDRTHHKEFDHTPMEVNRCRSPFVNA